MYNSVKQIPRYHIVVQFLCHYAVQILYHTLNCTQSCLLYSEEDFIALFFAFELLLLFITHMLHCSTGEVTDGRVVGAVVSVT